MSNETGRPEVYVRPFPGEGAVRISNGGGIYPRWRTDGHELFYIAPDMSLMAVPIQVAPGSRTLVPGAAVARFSTRMAMSGPYIFTAGFLGRPQYDVVKDGRFLMNIPVADAVTPPIAIVQNWTIALRAHESLVRESVEEPSDSCGVAAEVAGSLARGGAHVHARAGTPCGQTHDDVVGEAEPACRVSGFDTAG